MIAEEIKNLIPKNTCLIFVDYRDNLNEAEELLQQCLSDNSTDPISERVDDWYIDHELSSLEDYMKDLKSNMVDKLDYSEEEAEDYVNRHEDEIKDIIYERCDDDTVADLLKNTGKEVMFYQTGLEIPEDSWCWKKKDLNHWRYEVKKKLGIKNNKNYDADIDMMLLQATYGGSLVIYFNQDIKPLIHPDYEIDFQKITFGSPNIAVINTGNGSGDSTFLKHHQCTFEFDRNNLFLERAIKYNYTYEVCGMSSDWCDDTSIALIGAVKQNQEQSSNPILQQMKYDKECDEVYKKGDCTFGDMDTRRHRNVQYINNFPCGNKCPHCGTFWID